MLTDGENNLFCNLVGKPVRKHMEPLITDEINKYMKEIDKKIKAEEKEEKDAMIKSLLPTDLNKPIRNVIHDETAIGIKQDALTGDIILGQPQPVTTVDQSFSMKAVTQLPEPVDCEIRAVVDPLIKKVKIVGASPTANIQMGSPIPVPDIPLGLTIVPKGMFNRMRYEVWKYALDHLDKSDKIEFPFNDDTVYTVWTCKTLQNWKALISTNLPDGMYYECTYNGDTQEMYLDAYKKFENKTIKIEQSDT